MLEELQTFLDKVVPELDVPDFQPVQAAAE
jgi:hypothetical protein